MQKTTGTAEMTDGRTVTARIGIATKIAFEKAAKANGWTAEANPSTTTLFWVWHATRVAGEHDQTFADFQAACIDAEIERDDQDGGDDDELDPTQPGPGTELLSP